MTDDKIQYYTPSEVIGVLNNQINILNKNKLKLAFGLLLGISIGISYFYLQQPKYTATTTFILEEKSIGGGLSGMASQFGIDLSMLGGSSGNLYSGDNILEILKSKRILNNVLLSPADSNHRVKLVDVYIQEYKLTKKWTASSEYKNVKFDSTNGLLTNIQDSALNNTYNDIVEKRLKIERVNKKGSALEFSVTLKNKDLARTICERAVNEAIELYLQIKTNTATQNVNRLQQKADSILSLLNRQSYKVAHTSFNDLNTGYRASSVPLEIASRDRTILSTIYGEVVKNLEASKLLLTQQTPVIQIIDKPNYALPDNKMSLAKSVILSAIAGIIISSLAVSLFSILKPTN